MPSIYPCFRVTCHDTCLVWRRYCENGGDHDKEPLTVTMPLTVHFPVHWILKFPVVCWCFFKLFGYNMMRMDRGMRSMLDFTRG